MLLNPCGEFTSTVDFGQITLKKVKIKKLEFWTRQISNYRKKNKGFLTTNNHYRYFTRLNNRKKYQTLDNFINAKYLHNLVNFSKNINEICQWCSTTFKPGSWIFDNRYTFVFSNATDYIMFKMRWDYE